MGGGQAHVTRDLNVCSSVPTTDSWKANMQVYFNNVQDSTMTGRIGSLFQIEAWMDARLRYASLHDEALTIRQMQHVMSTMTGNDSICSAFHPHGESPAFALLSPL